MKRTVARQSSFYCGKALFDISLENIKFSLFSIKNLTCSQFRLILRISKKERRAIKNEKKKTVGDNSRIITAVLTVVTIAVISVLLSHFVFPVVQVKGTGNAGFDNNDILVLLNKNDYEIGSLCCISYNNRILIRRVIAKGGDKVVIDASGNISVNGAMIDEPYVINKDPDGADMSYDAVVPEGMFFVLSDDRVVLTDSRDPGFGSINEDKIMGVILFKI